MKAGGLRRKARHIAFPKIAQCWMSPWRRTSEILHGLPCLCGKQNIRRISGESSNPFFSFQLKRMLPSQTRMAVNSQKITQGLKSLVCVQKLMERCKTLKSCAPESQLIIPEQTCFGDKGQFALTVSAYKVQQWHLSITLSYEHLSNLQRHHFPQQKYFFGPATRFRTWQKAAQGEDTPWGCASPSPQAWLSVEAMQVLLE